MEAEGEGKFTRRQTYEYIKDGKYGQVENACKCGTQFTVDHAMTCHLGGFPTIQHNEIRDITATLLTEVCHNVATEPPLQPLTGETLTARSANTNDNARLPPC